MQRITTALHIAIATLLISITSLALAENHGNNSEAKNTHNGLTVIKSVHNVANTAEKLEMILTQKGMTVFARFDHSAGAKKVGKILRPTELIIFGNPKVGTPLMQCAQSIAIDLPQKMLIWEDSEGITWLAYNDPQYLKQRHDVNGCDKVFAKIAGALHKFATAASQ
jgi:uncharacterized protein (DUF302 family)